MELANLESREVLLAKLAGAMKGSFAKAARIIDALRIKMEASAPVSEPTANIAEAVSEPTANIAEAEVPAPAATTEDVAVTEDLPTPETEEKE
jgi:large subunit ribosomal protein L10